MGFKYLLIGAGDQGVAIAHWLLQRIDTEEVQVADRDFSQLHRLASKLSDPRLRINQVVLPGGNVGILRKLMTRADVAIGATTYRHYVMLTRMAIDCKCHWVDLGGKIAVRKEQVALAPLAEAAGVSLSTDNGIAPGWVSIPARYVLDLFGGEADYLYERVGGIPQQPIEPIGYAWVFAADGLIQEMEAEAEMLVDGQIVTVQSLTGLENHQFPPPFNTLQSVRTSDGNSTFPQTFAGKVKKHDYATLRYPGHWPVMIAMRDLGFWSPGKLHFGEAMVSPREMTVKLLDQNLPKQVPDALVLRIIGGRDGIKRTFDMICLHDEATGLSAMQQSTGFSAAITARQLASGQITKRGEVRLERDAPIKESLQEWADSGLKLREVDPEERLIKAPQSPFTF